MKPLLFACVLLLALAIGAGAALVGSSVLRGPDERPGALAAPARAEPAEAPIGPELEGLRAEIAMLSGRLAKVQDELGRLRDAAERTPVQPASLEGSGAAAKVEVPPIQRQAVLQILEEERQREEDEREAQRKERELRAIENRAGRVARELGMSPADERRLVELMVIETQRRDELIAQVRDGGFDRETMRQSMQELQRWRSDELAKSFGPSLAQQIGEQGADWGGGGRRRGGNFGLGGGGPGGGGAQGDFFLGAQPGGGPQGGKAPPPKNP
ncbi:MAG TPA: hypothetical protein VMS76_20170 [Planctomycetota bacterium]|nr:hypothetical protein [Planctomycetota bacterium]